MKKKIEKQLAVFRDGEFQDLIERDTPISMEDWLDDGYELYSLKKFFPKKGSG